MEIINNNDLSTGWDSIFLGNMGASIQAIICGLLTGYLIYLILCETKFSSSKASIYGIAIISAALVGGIGIYLANLVTLLGHYMRH